LAAFVIPGTRVNLNWTYAIARQYRLLSQPSCERQWLCFTRLFCTLLCLRFPHSAQRFWIISAASDLSWADLRTFYLNFCALHAGPGEKGLLTGDRVGKRLLGWGFRGTA
jgi:hypothetical protein